MTTNRKLISRSVTLPVVLGGKPVRTQPFAKRRTMGDAEKQAVAAVMDTDCLSGFLGAPGRHFDGGTEVRAFEQKWAQSMGVPHALSFNSLTTGLTAAMGAIGIEPGDEVICPPYTMSASATSALFYGGVPVFADIDPETFCIDPASVAARITPRTRAVVAVHLFGHPADMDALLAICEPRGIAVIEDAAQAPGVHYRGRAVGSIGAIGGFSLNYHKHIHTGEGGVMTTRDPKLARRLSLIRNHGENAVAADASPEELSNTIGSNYRLTELQAAIGSAQLPRLGAILEHRQRLAARLSERLQGLPGISPAITRAGCEHAFYIYPIRFDAEQAGLSRSQFARAVAAELPPPAGWETTPLAEGYVKPIYLTPLYQQRTALGKRGFPFSLNTEQPSYAKGLCPVTERAYAQNLLVTPLVREPLVQRDIDDFADAIEKVLSCAAEIGATDLAAGATPFTPTAAASAGDVR
jgi:dTDP-4-amino-4,6-dideoxygalactose transaminase